MDYIDRWPDCQVFRKKTDKIERLGVKIDLSGKAVTRFSMEKLDTFWGKLKEMAKCGSHFF